MASSDIRASSDIAHQRLYNQHISSATFDNPADVVRWLGAVQAQDFTGALWAVGLRMKNATEADVEQALADRTIIRTWPMRGTLHFVAAEDAHWMMELLTPRVVAGIIRRSQMFDLDDRIIARSKELIARSLEGGKQLRRDAIYKLLERARISTTGGRGLHILSRLAHDRIICFGAREGKQQTFALLDEWVPGRKLMARDESLAELARRYFTSHGPAALQDFVWWSGLRVADARAAIEMAKPELAQEVIDGQTYWLASAAPAAKVDSPTAYLLPPFDEYTVAYKDRSAALDPAFAKLVNSGNGIFSPTIVINGQVAGTWKRALKKDALVITPGPFAKFNKVETRAFAAAANRYGKFLPAKVAL